MTWVMLLALGAGPVGADELSWPLGDQAGLTWSRADGLTLTWASQRLWSAPGAELVLHDTAWTTQRFSSSRGDKRARREMIDGVEALVVEHSGDGFQATQTILPGDGGFELRWSWRQDGWDDAALQLGLGRPREDVWAGCQVTTENGPSTIPLTYQNRPAIGGARTIRLSSLTATLAVESSRPLQLYDYASRNGSFWLGFDDASPRGRQHQFSARVTVGPPELAAGGVRLRPESLPRRVADGRLHLRLALTREGDGPRDVVVRATADGQIAEQPVALSEQPRSVELSLDLVEPGPRSVALAVVAAGRTLLAPPPHIVQVVPPLRVVPGRSFFNDAQGSVRAVVAAEVAPDGLALRLTGPGIDRSAVPTPGRPTTVAVPDLPEGMLTLTCRLERDGRLLGEAPVTLRRLPPKANQTVIDWSLGGGLVVDGLPLLPVGFYCDHPPLREIDEDAQMGWTHVAPYIWDHATDGDAERQTVVAMLDRVHAAGLKIKYNLHGLAVRADTDEEFATLRREIELVRDHPALLGWYLADEPELNDVAPELMTKVFEFVRELDPHHPCLQVFANRGQAKRYENALDISMTDPYPIPNSSVIQVAEATRHLIDLHRPEIPVWIVPQAFGGGEWWEREPSAGEERVMTWLALIEGAKGLQYFIRRAPNGNPVSVHLWNECRRLAAEVWELQPELLTDDRTPLTAEPAGPRAALFRSPGALLVAVANPSPRPTAFRLPLPGVADAEWQVVFEQRDLAVTGGAISDLIDGLGTRLYRLALTPPSPLADDEPGNLVRNASFEQWTNPGTPDAYYMTRSADPAGSARLDPRVAADGRHSLCVVAPTPGGGPTLRPFPIPLRGGTRYRLTLLARSREPGARLWVNIAGIETPAMTAEIGRDWTEVVYEGVAPADRDRGQIAYRLESAGMVWIDALRLVALPAET